MFAKIWQRAGLYAREARKGGAEGMMLMSSRVAKYLVVVCAAMCAWGAGCKSKPEDEVVAQYQRGESAIAAKNSTEYQATMSPESVQRLRDCLEYALVATEEDAKALPAGVMEMVLKIRNRISPEQVRRMTADDILAWQIDNGSMVVDKEYGIVPESVMIRGESAVIQMGERVRSGSSRFRVGRRGTRAASMLVSEALGGGKIEPIPGLVANFRRIEGYWYADWLANEVPYDTEMKSAAKEQQMSLWQLVAAIEEDEFGSIKKDIWVPPGR